MTTGVAITGAAETDELGRLPGLSAMQLHAQAAHNALHDAGLTIGDVDGVASAGESPVDVADYLGVRARWLDGTHVGGCSFLVHVQHAAAAIQAGVCDTVLITHGESGRSRVGMDPWAPPSQSHRAQFELPYGPVGPPSAFPIGVLRFMHEYGLTHEQLAMVPVVQREWAHGTPRAKMRELITVDDVLESPVVAYPMHLLECCLVTDGGGALVLQAAERAKDGRRPAVHVLGAGEAAESSMVSMMEDLTSSRAFVDSSRAALDQARVTRDEIDHLMIYDAFAHVPVYGLCDLGFVERGDVGAFIAEGNTAPGGALPMNTNGGGLSYTHTGMYGMFAIQEAVRQLRGEAPMQVPDVDVSLVQAVGGMFMSAATLVLGTQDVADTA